MGALCRIVTADGFENGDLQDFGTACMQYARNWIRNVDLVQDGFAGKCMQLNDSLLTPSLPRTSAEVSWLRFDEFFEVTKPVREIQGSNLRLVSKGLFPFGECTFTLLAKHRSRRKGGASFKVSHGLCMV